MQDRSIVTQSIFVIKKHDATSLHYDFRLAWNGVLKSWAMPVGPSYCPDHRREAIQMVDHAKEHAAFEGMFPEGRPGAGTVMLWDRGTWELQSGCVDVDAALRDGCLKFTLYGEKIKGNWTLLRIADKQVGERLLWWLIKDTDQFARSLSEPGILDEAPDSVGTGRSLEQIAADWVKGKGKSVSQLELF